MNFGEAVEKIKAGIPCCRAGWNGKGMFIFLNRGSSPTLDPIAENQSIMPLIDGVNQKLFDLGAIGTVTRLPNLNMKAATGSTVTGWLASQTDILAEDWIVATLPNNGSEA